jgi:hypothetical protein
MGIAADIFSTPRFVNRAKQIQNVKIVASSVSA